MDEAYNKLKLVLQRAHDLNIVLKMSKTWLGFRSVQFFGYKITGSKIELTQERKDAIQAMDFPKNTKMMQSFLGSALFFKDFVPNYSDHAAILHDTTH